MYGFLDKHIAAGHQVYIVCPAIEENEAMGDLQAVTTYYTETACALLPEPPRRAFARQDEARRKRTM